jgi:hypothetical protein
MGPRDARDASASFPSLDEIPDAASTWSREAAIRLR